MPQYKGKHYPYTPEGRAQKKRDMEKDQQDALARKIEEEGGDLPEMIVRGTDFPHGMDMPEMIVRGTDIPDDKNFKSWLSKKQNGAPLLRTLKNKYDRRRDERGQSTRRSTPTEKFDMDHGSDLFGNILSRLPPPPPTKSRVPVNVLVKQGHIPSRQDFVKKIVDEGVANPDTFLTFTDDDPPTSAYMRGMLTPAANDAYDKYLDDVGKAQGTSY